MESKAATTQIIGEDTFFLYFFFSDKLLMIYKMIVYIQFRHVLDFYLGFLLNPVIIECVKV